MGPLADTGGVEKFGRGDVWGAAARVAVAAGPASAAAGAGAALIGETGMAFGGDGGALAGAGACLTGDALRGAFVVMAAAAGAGGTAGPVPAPAPGATLLPWRPAGRAGSSTMFMRYMAAGSSRRPGTSVMDMRWEREGFGWWRVPSEGGLPRGGLWRAKA